MDAKTYIRTLVRAGAKLQEIRDTELRSAPHPSVTIGALDEAFRFAIRSRPPSPTSGLVEVHRWTAKLRAGPPATSRATSASHPRSRRSWTMRGSGPARSEGSRSNGSGRVASRATSH